MITSGSSIETDTWYLVGDVSVRVQAPQTVMVYCERALRPYRREKLHGTTPATNLEITPSETGWSLLRNGQEQAWRSAARRLVIPLLDCIVFEVLRLLPDGSLAIHGASLHWQSTLVVLVGPSGRGKSTAVLNLLSTPIQLMSDELTILEDGASRAIPVPRPLNGSGGEDQEGTTLLTLPQSQGGFLQVTLPNREQVPREPVEVQEIHFLYLKRPATPTGLRSIRRSRVMHLLAPQMLAPKEPRRRFSLLARALRQSAYTHELRYVDFPAVRNEVLSLLGLDSSASNVSEG